jgi:ATP-dependent Clp protease ATP-binding subunit ClpA
VYRFTGFTESANNALNSAVESAENLGHTYIGSEHILLGLLSDPKAMNLTLNYGSLHAELKVNIGVAEANIDGLNKEELIANCNAAINATLNPNFNLNYAFYKDLKDFGIR